MDGRGTAWGGSAVLSGGSLFLPRACWLFGKDGTMSSSSCRKFLHQAVALVVSAMASSQGVTLWRLVAPSRMPRATWSKFRSRGGRGFRIRCCYLRRSSFGGRRLLGPGVGKGAHGAGEVRDASSAQQQQQRWRNHHRLRSGRLLPNSRRQLSALLLGLLRGRKPPSRLCSGWTR